MMEALFEEERRAVCDVCHKLWQRGIVAANDGNVSMRLPDGTYLCTPSGVSKIDITPQLLIRIDADGRVLQAPEGKKPSSELKMHMKCYAVREDVGAVVHAHPPVSTAYASAGRALDGYQVMEAVVNLGAVPVVPYAKPSTDAVAEGIAPYLKEHDGLLLAHHGALTLGADLQSAYFRMETLEMYAKTSLYIHLLGGAPDMTEEQIDELIDLRDSGYHLTGRHPGYVKYNAPEQELM